jgi:hypothetical protein
MDEDRFWKMIEAAWSAVGGKAEPRQRLAEGRLQHDGAFALEESLEKDVVPALRQQLGDLPAEELLAFDRIRSGRHPRADGRIGRRLSILSRVHRWVGSRVLRGSPREPESGGRRRGVRVDVLFVVACV